MERKPENRLGRIKSLLASSSGRLSAATISTFQPRHLSAQRYEYVPPFPYTCFATRTVDRRHAMHFWAGSTPAHSETCFSDRSFSADACTAPLCVYIEAYDNVLVLFRRLPSCAKMSGSRRTSLLAAVLLLVSFTRRARAVDSLPSYWTQGIATNYGGQQDGMVRLDSSLHRSYGRLHSQRSAIIPWVASFQLQLIMKSPKMVSSCSGCFKSESNSEISRCT